jgi:two-component system, chemotaxis family, protein-glutamate methylesterase/glutaminase
MGSSGMSAGAHARSAACCVVYDSVRKSSELLPGAGTSDAVAGPGGEAWLGTLGDGASAYDVVGIAASLGGVKALSRILADLPADFPLPILVVQHLHRKRPSMLARVLGHHTALRVTFAEEGDRPAPGRVYVAPPDRHLLVRADDGALGLSFGAPVNHCRPSADVLFRSLADTFGPRAIALVLTGMGHDGARGMEAVARAGGAAIAQDAASAEAAGMPRAAVEIGHADLILPLDRIAFALTVLAGDADAGGDTGAHSGAGPGGSRRPWAGALRSPGRSSPRAF